MGHSRVERQLHLAGMAKLCQKFKKREKIGTNLFEEIAFSTKMRSIFFLSNLSCTFPYIPACNRCCHALGSLFFDERPNAQPMNNIFSVLFQILNMKEKLAWSGLKVIYTGSSKIVKEVKIRYLSTSNSNIVHINRVVRLVSFF